MSGQGEGRLLGDFVKGRFQFLEDFCQRNGLDFAETSRAVQAETLRLAEDPARQAFFRDQVFSGPVLATTLYPEWVDRILLQALSNVLKGPGAPLHTTSSKVSCIPFEAGRFNARRQAASVFRPFFQGKTPENWLGHGFLMVLQRCYGDGFAGKGKVVEVGPNHYQVHIDNDGVPQASRMECSTGVGYIYEGLLLTGAKDPVVTHLQCRSESPGPDRICIYDVTWK